MSDDGMPWWAWALLLAATVLAFLAIGLTAPTC